ncbi:MAG: hypothetical protein NZ922_02655 [Candidatus Methanomethyliaceae archaeon]|nr:hypothetical protein [Candidatus Methanomethyliaceae archaeon]MDW7970930.1 hypothetical protein [Nitrososphaerota archaeon]
MSEEVKKLYDDKKAEIKHQLKKFIEELSEAINKRKEEIYKEVL